MQRFIYYLQRIGVWCRRVRQRRGYNIHSPFAFQLVKGVIYQRGCYYAYEELHQTRKGQALPERDDRLIFRLANDNQPRTALFVGPDTLDEQRYVAAACQKCTCHCATTSEEALQQAHQMGHIDFLFLNTSDPIAPLLDALLSYAGPRALFITYGIHRSRATLQAWREWIKKESVRVTFDLYWLGLAYFEARLNKQDYTINY
ncbi:hypothetical protein [Alloprevotella rava]|uniref:Uncharacterized protein n=1 Tax=Alloprevotella rava TaxID=671218 RepID=A0A7W5YG98_9BACT|nr:hypothetical protein [Alloprevotella rava]MBB3702881.1 hypothetical protein [Alloprevotella rava]